MAPMLWDRLTSTVAGVGSGSSRRSSPSTAGSSTTSATTKGSTTFSGPASSSSSRSDTSTALSSSPTPPYNGHHNSSASKLPPDSASNWQHISNSSFSVAPLRVRKSASFAQLPGNGHRGAGEQAGSVGASWGRDSDYSFGPPPRASTTNLRLDAYGLGGGASHHYPQVARPPPQRRSPPQRPPTWELHQLDYRSQQSYQQQLGFGGPPLGRASREYLRGSIGGGGPPERYAVQEPPPRNPRRESYRPPYYQHPNGQRYPPELRDSRRASSVYSQPSPTAAQFAAAKVEPLRLNTARGRPAPNSGAVDEVSPPSSPDVRATRDGPHTRHSPVSPIDEPAAMSQPTDASPPRKEARSNIPMMRRERRLNNQLGKSPQEPEQATFPSQSSLKPAPTRGDVRWDRYTGERTSNNQGVPSQVKPIEYARGFEKRTAATDTTPPKMGRDAYLSHPAVSFGERVRKLRAGSQSSSETNDAVGGGTAASVKSVGSVGSGASGSSNAGVGAGRGAHPGSGSASAAAPVSQTAPAVPSKPVVVAPAANNFVAAPTVSTTSTATGDSSIPVTQTRPEWKGASGRTALVAPVADNKSVPPLNIPRKSSKRATRIGAGAAGVSDGAATTAGARALSPISPVSPPGSSETKSPTTGLFAGIKKTRSGTSGSSGGATDHDHGVVTGDASVAPSSNAAATAAASLFSSAFETIRRVVPSSQHAAPPVMQGTATATESGPSAIGAASISNSRDGLSTSGGAQAYPSPPLSGDNGAHTNSTSDASNATSSTGAAHAAGAVTPSLAKINERAPAGAVANNTAVNKESVVTAVAHNKTTAPVGSTSRVAPPTTTTTTIESTSKVAPSTTTTTTTTTIPSTTSAKPAALAPQHSYGVSTSSSVYSHHPAADAGRPPQTQAATATPASTNDPWVQPASRFSVTTYATSARSSSPRQSFDVDSSAPPVPTPPQHFAAQFAGKEAVESSTTNNKASIDTSSTSMIDRKRPPLLGRTGGTGLGLGLDEPIRISLTSSPYSDSTRSNRGPSPFTSGSTPNPLRSNPSTLSRVYNNSNSPSMGSTAAAARDPRTNSVWSTMTSNTAYTNISVHTIAENDTPSAPPATKTPGDTNKSLPPAPPEASVLALVSHNKGSAVNGTGTAGLLSGVESVSDRVAILNARLEALSHRRLNLTRSIKQMTELMPTDLLVASEAVIKKRELEKRKVEALRNELADVQREEYELGLKLHRAYKRLDRESEYERTTLWVRRVTD